jgi:hypothetical protein
MKILERKRRRLDGLLGLVLVHTRKNRRLTSEMIFQTIKEKGIDLVLKANQNKKFLIIAANNLTKRCKRLWNYHLKRRREKKK